MVFVSWQDRVFEMEKENEAPALCDKTDSEPLPKRPKRLSVKLPCKKKVLSENVVCTCMDVCYITI